MKFLSVVFVSLFLSISAQAITIGFIPGGDAEKVRKGAAILAEELQSELGVPINVYVSKDYSGLIDAMKTKKVDFAFFTALTFVAAEQEVGVKVLLKKVWDEPFYYSTLITHKKNKIRNLQDLKGKKIAFVDKKSTSGFLYPTMALRGVKLQEADYQSIFSGSHSASVKLLQAKDVDAIAVFSDDREGLHSAWAKYSEDKKVRTVRFLWTSEPIPNDPFCVRQDFYDKNPKLVHNLMFSLIDIVEKLKEREEIKEFIGAEGFLPATTKQYDSVRKIFSDLKKAGGG